MRVSDVMINFSLYRFRNIKFSTHAYHTALSNLLCAQLVEQISHVTKDKEGKAKPYSVPAISLYLLPTHI